MPEYISLIVLGLGVLALVTLLFGVFSSLARRAFGVAAGIGFALLSLILASLIGLLALSIQGYQALTDETLAAVVHIQPTGEHQFMAAFEFPDGRKENYQLAGDQLYVDAHVLKWKPWANILGLKTAYQLDRVTGRYLQLDDEISRPRTVYPLTDQTSFDIFELRQQYELLSPLLDADYGSATFKSAQSPVTYEIRISTTGLLIRER